MLDVYNNVDISLIKRDPKWAAAMGIFVRLDERLKKLEQRPSAAAETADGEGNSIASIVLHNKIEMQRRTIKTLEDTIGKLRSENTGLRNKVRRARTGGLPF